MAVDTLLAEVALALRQAGVTAAGLGEPELWQLERAIGARLPRCLRVTLTRVGLRDNPFGLHASELAWVAANDRVFDRLQRALASGEVPAASEMEHIIRNDQVIAFAPHGAGQLVLRGSDDEGLEVLCHDPDGEMLEPIGDSFEGWARRGWDGARRGLVPAQRRAVQFSFWSPNEWLLERLVAEVGGALEPQWSAPIESSTGVVAWEQCLYIEGNAFRVRRMEHPSWRVPLVSVVVADAEPAQEVGWVAWFRDAFRRAGIEVQEVDLGPVAPPEPYRSSLGRV